MSSRKVERKTENFPSLPPSSSSSSSSSSFVIFFIGLFFLSGLFFSLFSLVLFDILSQKRRELLGETKGRRRRDAIIDESFSPFVPVQSCTALHLFKRRTDPLRPPFWGEIASFPGAMSRRPLVLWASSVRFRPDGVANQSRVSLNRVEFLIGLKRLDFSVFVSAAQPPTGSHLGPNRWIRFTLVFVCNP